MRMGPADFGLAYMDDLRFVFELGRFALSWLLPLFRKFALATLLQLNLKKCNVMLLHRPGTAQCPLASFLAAHRGGARRRSHHWHQ